MNTHSGNQSTQGCKCELLTSDAAAICSEGEEEEEILFLGTREKYPAPADREHRSFLSKEWGWVLAKNTIDYEETKLIKFKESEQCQHQ